MLEIIFIVSAVSLFLFTDFEKIFIVILDTVFELIKSVFIIIFLVKRFLVKNISFFSKNTDMPLDIIAPLKLWRFYAEVFCSLS